MKLKISLYFTTSDQPLETFLPVLTAQILTFGARQPAEILIVRILKYPRGRTVRVVRLEVRPENALGPCVEHSLGSSMMGVADLNKQA